MQIMANLFYFVLLCVMGALPGGVHWVSAETSVNFVRNADCEELTFRFQEQLRTLRESFAFRWFSRFLPEAPHFEDCAVAAQQDSLLGGWMRKLPIMGGFLKASDEAQQCELALRQMEMEAERFNDQLKSNWLLRRIVPLFPLGEGDEVLSWGKGMNVYTLGVAGLAAVSVLVGGILWAKYRKSTKVIKDKSLEELEDIVEIANESSETIEGKATGEEEQTEDFVEISSPIEEEMNKQEETSEEGLNKEEEKGILSGEAGDIEETSDPTLPDEEVNNSEVKNSEDEVLLRTRDIGTLTEDLAHQVDHHDKVLLNGKERPERLLHSTHYRSSQVEKPVKLRIEEHGVASADPITVPRFFERTVSAHEGEVALRVKRDGRWEGVTYGEYYNDVRAAAKGLIHLGLKRYHGVAIFGNNAPEWAMAHLAAIHAGGVAAGIYPGCDEADCEHIGKDIKAQIYVVESQREVSIIKKVQKNLGQNSVIVQYTGIPEDGVLSWNDLLLLGQRQSDDQLEDRLQQIAVNQCCTVVYTPGTTAPSNGVMLSHDNLTWMANANIKQLGIKPKEFRQFSMVSLAHISGLLEDVYWSIAAAGTCYFADKRSNKDFNEIETLQEVRPTHLCTIPAFWENIYSEMMVEGEKAPWMRVPVADWIEKEDTEEKTKKILKLVRDKLERFAPPMYKRKLGLGKSNTFVCGGGHISKDVMRLFRDNGMKLVKNYVLTEATGPHACGKDHKMGACGKVTEGFYSKIRDPDAMGKGEILLNGRNIAMGYLNLSHKTDLTIDEDGWLHTGDVGRINKKGFLYVLGSIGRQINLGGNVIHPEPIEADLKAKLPGISAAVLVSHGEQLGVVTPLKTNLDPDSGMPLDTLEPLTVKWLKDLGIEAKTGWEAVNLPQNWKLLKRIFNEEIELMNDRHNLERPHRIAKLGVPSKNFTTTRGELTSTFKVQMPVFLEMHKKYIIDIFERQLSEKK